jgi:hypothetical protein
MNKFQGTVMPLRLFLIGLLCWSACALADPPATRPQQLTSASTLDEVLDALDARGKNLRDFSASVRLSSVDNSIGSATAQTGKVFYQRNPGGDARIRVTFDKFDDGNKVMPQNHQYTLDAGWLVERNYDKKQEIRRQVLKPGEKMDPLKLGEGPFPLPIGQKKEDVKKLFDVARITPAQDDRWRGNFRLSTYGWTRPPRCRGESRLRRTAARLPRSQI